MAMHITQAVEVLEHRLPPRGGTMATGLTGFSVPGVVQGMSTEKQNRLLELHSQI